VGKRILVVDDDERILFVLEHALRGLGPDTEVITATNAAQALEQVSELRVDLVLTDLAMPGQDGIALTDALRGLIPLTPVIWITAHQGSTMMIEAQRRGVYRCLTKPVELHEIRAAARGALEATSAHGRTAAMQGERHTRRGRRDERNLASDSRALHGE
jgi:DNA-binding NtrC family response regulator